MTRIGFGRRATRATILVAGLCYVERVAPAGEPPPVACLATPEVKGPGVLDPFHVPAPEAKQQNADALGAYRQGRWDEARAKYRAAEAADPVFLAPILNVACSFVRQERMDEALNEVERLLERAFLPWSDEVLTAADLGALKVGPEGKRLRALLDENRRKWAEGLSRDLFFVARTRAPLKLAPAESGDLARTLVLGPRQEVFAWSPRTGRYRQVTAEQGRVLAIGLSRDRRRLAYVTAEKLVLTPGAAPSLRGAAIKEVDLGTLAPESETRVPGDVRRLEIVPWQAGGFAYRIDAETSPAEARADGRVGQGGATFAVRDGQLRALSLPRAAKTVCALTGKGVAPAVVPGSLPDGCAGSARDARSIDGLAGVEVTVGRGRNAARRTISGPFGGGLCGLALP